MAFVTLDGSGTTVTGIFASAQSAPTPSGYAVIPDNDPRVTAFLNPPSPAVYVPTWLIRQRLQAVGLWTQAWTALSVTPATLGWFLTLQQGVSPTDPNALALLQGIGANPSVILAAP